jgi:hypothetical protein
MLTAKMNTDLMRPPDRNMDRRERSGQRIVLVFGLSVAHVRG